MRSKVLGISLIELVITIIVMGIVAGSLLPAFSTVLMGKPEIEYSIQAVALARERLELILGQKNIKGFNNFADPCAVPSPPAICTPPAGFTVNAVINNGWNGSINFKEVTVNVTGNSEASLSDVVADY